MLNGKDLIELGIPQGPAIGRVLDIVREAQAHGAPDADLSRIALAEWARIEADTPARLALRAAGAATVHVYLSAGSNPAEDENRAAVLDTVAQMMRTPVVTQGAVMPDACPAGSLGTIPVGGVAASTAIHPGMHSADICCSMYLSTYALDRDLDEMFETIRDHTHFGPGGRRDRIAMPEDLIDLIMSNRLTADLIDTARDHFGTQGDGNHFAYIGVRESDGAPTLVTHHGSRGFGAKLYKRGMAMADAHRRKVSPETLKQNAWIAPEEEAVYWDALQVVRAWTKANHAAIHAALGPSDESFWNEHNFVFRRDDLYYHAKGATPTGFRWADDATGRTIIPLNMAQPILIVEPHPEAPDGAMGFAPHGAGRNMSRTAHKRLLDGSVAEILRRETTGLRVEFMSGNPDVSELPSAYKDTATIIAEIEAHKLARVVDRVVPYGSMMAGDWEKDAPWRRKRAQAEVDS